MECKKCGRQIMNNKYEVRKGKILCPFCGKAFDDDVKDQPKPRKKKKNVSS